MKFVGASHADPKRCRHCHKVPRITHWRIKDKEWFTVNCPTIDCKARQKLPLREFHSETQAVSWWNINHGFKERRKRA